MYILEEPRQPTYTGLCTELPHIWVSTLHQATPDVSDLQKVRSSENKPLQINISTIIYKTSKLPGYSYLNPLATHTVSMATVLCVGI